MPSILCYAAPNIHRHAACPELLPAHDNDTLTQCVSKSLFLPELNAVQGKVRSVSQPLCNSSPQRALLLQYPERPQLDHGLELPLRFSLDEMVRLGVPTVVGSVLEPTISHGSWHRLEFCYPLLDPCSIPP